MGYYNLNGKIFKFRNAISVGGRDVQLNLSTMKPYQVGDSYGIDSIVVYNGNLYISLKAQNTDLPTVPGSWKKIFGGVEGIQDKSSLTGYVDVPKKAMTIDDMDKYATKDYVNGIALSGAQVDLSNYYTKQQVSVLTSGCLNENSADQKYATFQYVNEKLSGEAGGLALSSYYDKTQVDEKVLQLSNRIDSLLGDISGTLNNILNNE